LAKWPKTSNPIVAAGSSDLCALDAVFEVLVRAGRSAHGENKLVA